jgi:aldose 1-epimerase
MIQKASFGKLRTGQEIFQYSLSNKSGTLINIINLGAAVKNIFFRNKNSRIEDLVFGYDSIDDYLNDRAFLGAIVGRYGNRIAGGKFQLEGKQYQVSINDGPNHLHGGNKGFNKVFWEAEELEEGSVKLVYISPDGEEGYPGKVKLEVVYSLTEEDELKINYQGTTDKTTILNPTHHSYFNLTGNFEKNILEHEIEIDADNYTPVNFDQIPKGQIEKIENTPFDFRTRKKIGKNITEDHEQLKFGKGYDHNFVLNNFNHKTRRAASLYENSSGRLLEVFTDQPGLQFYTGNFLDGTIEGKGGIKYNYRTGLCLEAQLFPDTPNNPSFPSAELKPGNIYRQETIYKFSIK